MMGRRLQACLRAAPGLVAVILLASACSTTTPASSPKVTRGTSRSTGTPAKANTLAVRPSVGCSSPAHAELTLAKQTLKVDGVTRWYLMSTPPATAATHPLPLVLDFHGLGEGA